MKNEFWRNFWRRKTKFIDRRQQSRFAFEMIVIVILFPCLFFVMVCHPLFAKIFLGKDAETLSALFINQIQMIRSVWWVVLFCLVYTILLSIFWSHKIFGPMFRLSQAVRAKLNGEENIHCRLRKGDYFEEFADLLRELIEKDNNKSQDTSKDS